MPSRSAGRPVGLVQTVLESEREPVRAAGRQTGTEQQGMRRGEGSVLVRDLRG